MNSYGVAAKDLDRLAALKKFMMQQDRDQQQQQKQQKEGCGKDFTCNNGNIKTVKTNVNGSAIGNINNAEVDAVDSNRIDNDDKWEHVLPPEVWEVILSKVSRTKDLKAVSLVCTSFRYLDFCCHYGPCKMKGLDGGSRTRTTAFEFRTTPCTRKT